MSPLDSIADIMKADTAMRAEIGAHTDNAGTAAESQHLTNLQAEAVRTYLVTKGVPLPAAPGARVRRDRPAHARQHAARARGQPQDRDQAGTVGL